MSASRRPPARDAAARRPDRPRSVGDEGAAAQTDVGRRREDGQGSSGGGARVTGAWPPWPRASALVRAAVEPLVTKGRAALARVARGDDPEAVHDARVQLRRLRSVFRAGAPLYEKAHVKAVRAALAEAASHMGPIRDAEALDELLRGLPLDHDTRARLERWLDARAARLGGARRALSAWAAGPESSRALDLSSALVLLPVAPKRDSDADAFAARIAKRAERDIADSPFARDDDVRLHERRIAWKRLRYVLRAFAEALPPVVVAREEHAKRQQEWLGVAHDTHVARALLARARGLGAPDRLAIGAALDRAREDALDRALEDSSSGDEEPEGRPPPARDARPKGKRGRA